MTVYAIGDVQGCFAELQELLQLIEFNQDQDVLWFVGDLVNRGPQSLATLRFVKNLKNAVTVLGNHDLHLLAIYHRKDPLMKRHDLNDILAAPDAEELIDWLRTKPLLYHDAATRFVVTHAGIYPNWSLTAAKEYAREVENVLRSDNYVDFLKHMYGNEPDIWNENLIGIPRLRFILNAFVRMRFSTLAGKLDFVETGAQDSAPPGFMPWYDVPNRAAKNEKIIFGHWAALQGNIEAPNVYALDTGCVWGGSLTAMRIPDCKLFSVPCL